MLSRNFELIPIKIGFFRNFLICSVKISNSLSPLGQYQRDMLSHLRKVNADYHQVGWYQSTYLGPHFSQVFLESHFQYQLEIEESVVLIYGRQCLSITQYISVYYSADPLKTTLGNLSLRGFRLTKEMLVLLKNNDVFTPER